MNKSKFQTCLAFEPFLFPYKPELQPHEPKPGKPRVFLNVLEYSIAVFWHRYYLQPLITILTNEPDIPVFPEHEPK